MLALSGGSAGLAVILGAFAAHGLKNVLEPHLLSVFQTGVQYQFLHSLALILVVLLARYFPHALWNWCSGLFLGGIVCFSGSLYLLALTGVKWFGPVTPLGGVLFIVGWIVFCIAALKTGDNA